MFYCGSWEYNLAWPISGQINQTLRALNRANPLFARMMNRCVSAVQVTKFGGKQE